MGCLRPKWHPRLYKLLEIDSLVKWLPLCHIQEHHPSKHLIPHAEDFVHILRQWVEGDRLARLSFEPLPVLGELRVNLAKHIEQRHDAREEALIDLWPQDQHLRAVGINPLAVAGWELKSLQLLQ